MVSSIKRRRRLLRNKLRTTMAEETTSRRTRVAKKVYKYKAALEVRLVGDIPVGLGVGVDGISVGISVGSNDTVKVDMVIARS